MMEFKGTFSTSKGNIPAGQYGAGVGFCVGGKYVIGCLVVVVVVVVGFG